MRRKVAVLLVLVLVIGLCACGQETEDVKERECGVFIKVEAEDIYTVSCGTDTGSDSCSNADGSAIASGDVLHFDFAGDAAESSEPSVIDYSICIYDKDLNIITSNNFSSDFSNNARIDITVTADHRIILAGDKLTCGGDLIVEMRTDKPQSNISVAVPAVIMPNRTDAASAVNSNITSLNQYFVGKQLDENKKAYDIAVTDAGDGVKPESFSMSRYVRVARGDSYVLSLRMYYKTNLGVRSDIAITGHNYNTQTGAELALKDVASDLGKLKSICSEDVLIATTEDERFKDVVFNEGYTDTIVNLISDGHWFLSADGMVIAVNPGVIADQSFGSFEFTVSYSSLTDVLKAEYLPVSIPSGAAGDIAVSLYSDSKDSVALVGSEPDEDINAPLVTVSGSIYNICVYKATVKDNGKYSLDTQLWYCSDLTDGAAFAVNSEIGDKAIYIGFDRADGVYERRLLTPDGDGSINVTDPDGIEKGLKIDLSTPYQTDLNGDGIQDKMSLKAAENGLVSLVVSSSAKDYTLDTLIKGNVTARLYDIDSDGVREIFLSGKTAEGGSVCYAAAFDRSLNALKFGDSPYAEGTLSGFVSGKLCIKSRVSILGTYSAQSEYSYENGAFKPVIITLSDADYVTLTQSVKLTDGESLSSGTKLKFTETDGSSYISFVTKDGSTGSISIEKSDNGWTIDGKADTEYFDSLPYKS